MCVCLCLSIHPVTGRLNTNPSNPTGYGIQIGHDAIYTFMDDPNRERLAEWATNDNCAPQVGGGGVVKNGRLIYLRPLESI